MVLFLFLVIALVVVVGAVTLAVVGGGERAALPDVAAERFVDPLPPDRALRRADVEALRFPLTVRGYRMMDVDEALGRLAAELAERDAHIAELEAALAGAQATAVGGPGLLKTHAPAALQGETAPRDTTEEAEGAEEEGGR
ncbi:DivIVA domain-containing protein [Streptomyces sp. NBC_01283]|uniref:DivIVA domain-containing protein n=1 Tax=Streptomyces sp. NBC_01283 TaxID=2903812 RepID=UPI00352DA4E0|nr:DivIVA domain-containing protein [Streptomyces sp. NBC_01283]